MLADADRKRDAAEWSDAAALYEEALRHEPYRHDLAVQAGNCHKEAGDIERAVELYDSVTDPLHRLEANIQKVDALLRQPDVVQAIARLEVTSTATRFQPSHHFKTMLDAIVTAADRRRDDGRWAEATQLYELCLRLRPGWDELALQAGNCWKEAGDLDRAIAWYDSVRDASLRPEVAFQKGDALLRQGALERALASLGQAEAAAHPDAEARRVELGSSLAAAASQACHDFRWAEAGDLYSQALLCLPYRADLLFGAARSLTQAGQFDRAVELYDSLRDPARRAELSFEKGNALFLKGDFTGATEAFQEAVSAGDARAPERLYRSIMERHNGAGSKSPARPSRGGAFPVLDTAISEGALLNRITARSMRQHLLGSLDRSTHQTVVGQGFDRDPHVLFDQIGWLTLSNAGRLEPLLMGVVAVRARVLSRHQLERVDLVLNKDVIASETPSLIERHSTGKWLYSVNTWIDCERIRSGRAEMTLWAIDLRGSVLFASAFVNIARAPPSLNLADSDSFVPSPNLDCDDVAAEVLARPALVRSASRLMFPEEIREILVMRVDQLGDVSAALPAIKRLREIFPHARLTGLISSALCGLVEATGLCEEVLGLTLVYDHLSERRYLTDAEQDRITRRLESYKFDIAIDLCPADETRALLKLVNARYLVGFHPREFKFLDFGVDVFSRDKINQAGILSHAAFTSVLVEGLAAAMRPAQAIIPRRSDDSAVLGSYSQVAKDYVLIHSGARHRINCWPMANFLALASRISTELNLSVVFFSDEELDRHSTALLSGQRILFVSKIPIDHFDALIANSRMMIGNDSGPKHLAAVHGVETISIHVNRLNWREWGQDGQGLIISKTVPCCGCGLNNIDLCGKQAACITAISVDDVFDAVTTRLAAEVPELIGAEASV